MIEATEENENKTVPIPDGMWSELSELLTHPGARFGFECRLAAEDSRLDFGIAVTSIEAANALINLCRVQQAAEWSRIEAFCRAWVDPASALHRLVAYVFLEFDADRGDLLPLPSVFASLDAPLDPAPHEEVSSATFDSIFDVLIGGGRREAPAFDRCLRLPAGGRILHVGVMMGRPGATTRLSLSLPRSELRTYLRRIGWEGDAAEVEMDLSLLAPASDRAHLELDAGAVIGSRLGIVLSPGPSERLREQWLELFHALVERGLCAPEKRDALAAWPALGAEGAHKGGRFIALRREWSHVKLCYGGRRAVEVKAYITARLSSD